jgi:SAM-dependent methyltransferase/DNA-directed RNA polymerase subunit RPC12/RpoP
VDVVDRLRQHLRCARCATALDIETPAIACSACGQKYFRLGRIPVLLPRPDDHLSLWRRQLGLLVAQSQQMTGALEAEAGNPELAEGGKGRLTALARGVRDQLRQIVDVVGSALGGPLEPQENTGLPRGVVEYSYLLYRDWAWESAGNRECQQSMDSIRSVVTTEKLGQMLVVGAGACRLAYDLHRRLGPTETAVVDIDPFLFVFAEAVVRGAVVQFTESSTTVQELSRVARTWDLTAPDGPLGEDVFHFFLANGLSPPFADSTFDTVVTPWFIDQVPPDLPVFLNAVRRVLRPGGRWINHGPLIYPVDAPIARRFSREELFDLVARAGFRIERWQGDSQPHLVSPLTERGKMEWVLTFEAQPVK